MDGALRRVLKTPVSISQHQGVANTRFTSGLNRRGFVDYACVVEQQQRPRFSQSETYAVRAVCIEYARFTTFHAATVDQNDGNKVHAVPVRTFRRRAADSFRCVDAELVRLDKPLWMR